MSFISSKSKKYKAEEIHYENISANYYRSPAKTRNLVVLVHGLTPKGNTDARWENIITSFLRVDCHQHNKN